MEISTKMPLLSPSQIHQVLRQETPLKNTKEEKKELEILLENSGLTASEILESVSNIMRCGDSDTVRLRAAETALKLNGLMERDGHENVSVNIIIHDSEFTSINPILIPR
jgi:hypothetical protein